MNPIVLKIAGMMANKPTAQYAAVGWDNSPYITFFKQRNNTVEQLADPGTLPSNPILSVYWSLEGNYCLAIDDQGTAFCYTVTGNTVSFLWTYATLAEFSQVKWASEEAVDPDDIKAALYNSGTDRIFFRYEAKQSTSSASVTMSRAEGNIGGVGFLATYGNASEGSVVVGYTSGVLEIVRLNNYTLVSGAILTQPTGSNPVADVVVKNDSSAFAVLNSAATGNVIIYEPSGGDWDIAETVTVSNTLTGGQWSDDGDKLVVYGTASPYFHVIDFSSGSGVVSAPSTPPSAAGAATINDNGAFVVTASSATEYVEIQQNLGGTWTKVASVDFSFTESAANSIALKNNTRVA